VAAERQLGPHLLKVGVCGEAVCDK